MRVVLTHRRYLHRFGSEISEDGRRAHEARHEGYEVNESKEEARRAYEARQEGHEVNESKGGP